MPIKGRSLQARAAKKFKKHKPALDSTIDNNEKILHPYFPFLASRGTQ